MARYFVKFMEKRAVLTTYQVDAPHKVMAEDMVREEKGTFIRMDRSTGYDEPERLPGDPVIREIKATFRSSTIDWLGDGCYILNDRDVWKKKQDSQSFDGVAVVMERSVIFKTGGRDGS